MQADEAEARESVAGTEGEGRNSLLAETGAKLPGYQPLQATITAHIESLASLRKDIEAMIQTEGKRSFRFCKRS